jgi:hypothetical protein
MVTPMDLEVFGEVVDTLSEDRNLDLGRAGIGLVEPVLGDRRRLIGHAWRTSFLLVPADRVGPTWKVTETLWEWHR